MKNFLTRNSFYIFCCLLILANRLFTYYEPLELDITTYAVIAHEFLSGKLLYKELWDHKAPGNYLIFAIAELLFGYRQLSIFLINLFFSWLTLFAIAKVTKKISSEKSVKIALLLWSMLGGTIFAQSNQPNCEVFINPFLLFAFSNFLKIKDQKSKAINKSALFFALSTMIKQLTIISLSIFSIYLFIFTLIENKSLRLALKNTVLLVLPTIIIWSLVFGYFYTKNSIDSLIECVFIYNREYVGDINYNIFPISNFFKLANNKFIIIYAQLFLLTLLTFILNKNKYNSTMLGTFLFSSILMIMLPGRYYPHYYTLILPALIVCSSYTLEILETTYKIKAYRILALVICPFILIELPILTQTSAQISNLKYPFGGFRFDLTRDYAQEISSSMPKNYRVYHWGNDTGLYYYGKMTPATSLFYISPLIHNKARLEKVFQELKNSTPEAYIERTHTIRPVFLNNLIDNNFLKVNSLSKYGFDFYIRKNLNLSIDQQT